MSNFETLALITEGNISTAPNTFVASTTDSLGTITTAGYMTDKGEAGIVKANDLLYINYSDTSVFPLNVGESAVFGVFQVTYSTGVWSLSAYSTTSLTASVAITAAQFNGMYAAPKLLIAAPGANKTLIVNRMQLIMTYGSANYAAGGVVAAQYDSTVHGAGVLATNSEAAADFFAAASTVFNFNGAVVLAPFSTSVNKGLYLSNATQAFTTGDSTFVANIQYNILATA